VLADEPTAHLDYIHVDGVLRLLRQIADAGRLVVVATHDDRMLPLADRVVNLTPRHDTESRPPETVTLESGEVLFDQGDPGELVYVVEHGAVDIVRRQDGRDQLLTTVVDGGYFGWHRRSGCAAPPAPGLRHPAPSPATRCATSATGYDPAAWGTRVTEQGL
jgi:putative ABC transport system ATP-binding protein